MYYSVTVVHLSSITPHSHRLTVMEKIIIIGDIGNICSIIYNNLDPILVLCFSHIGPTPAVYWSHCSHFCPVGPIVVPLVLLVLHWSFCYEVQTVSVSQRCSD